MPKYTYRTCCVNSTASKIIAMTDQARQITWETFRKYVTTEELQGTYPFSVYQYHGEHYNPITGEQTSPLHISRDYAVSFHKSRYEGEPCVYICHSGIEYIFQENDTLDMPETRRYLERIRAYG